ncbi:MAG: hypothetical protein K9M99_12880 [Candidatus Cloacimonetes bacterium]|nr:hypothetical protein [Candidatus Cloacimonadota bacterium]
MGILERVQIKLPKLLLVEGKDEENFFSAFFKEMGINNIQIIVAGGKRNLKMSLEAVKRLPDFDDVTAIGIIQDSDENYAAAMNSVYDWLINLGFSPLRQAGVFSQKSPAIGIFIMPGDNENGALEDLCLQAVQSDPVMNCVKNFIDCIKEQNPSVSKVSKRECAAYLAGKEELVSSLGLAAQKKYWNFSSPVYATITEFIRDLSQK